MIQFIKNRTDVPLWAYNNNIIQYRDNSGETAIWSDIECDQFSVRLFPDPQGVFTFNFKEYVKYIFGKNKFADNVQLFITANPSSLVKNGTNGVYINLELQIAINRENQTTILTDVSYPFLAGIEILEKFKKGEIIHKDWSVLSPVETKSKDRHRINYWPGYPFDLSLYSDINRLFTFKNITNFIDINLQCNNRVNRIAFCDGSHDETIEDHFPLSFGHNKIEIKQASPRVDEPGFSENQIYLNLIKHAPRCGVYVKFRNQYGGWTYWLFHKENKRDKSSSSQDSINNDFNNLEVTTSPEIQTGKSPIVDTIKAYAIGLDNEDIRQLEYITDTPKIYLYTGERYSTGSTARLLRTDTDLNWIEIKCNTRRLTLKEPKRKRHNFELDFALPARESVGLL